MEALAVPRNASEVSRRVSELAHRLWKTLRDSKLQEAELGLDDSQSEARIAQVE